MRFVVVRCRRQGARGSPARVVYTAAVFRHRAQTRPVAELRTDKRNQTNGMGRGNEMGCNENNGK